MGAARAVDRARAERGLEALGALRASDRAGFVAAVQGLALLPAEAADDAYDLLDELAGDLVRGPVRFDAAAVSDLIDRALAAVARALPLTERLDRGAGRPVAAAHARPAGGAARPAGRDRGLLRAGAGGRAQRLGLAAQSPPTRRDSGTMYQTIANSPTMAVVAIVVAVLP